LIIKLYLAFDGLISIWIDKMKILIGVSHPKHVYMFRNFIHDMKKKGNEIEILLIEKDITENLLKMLNLEYTLIGKNPTQIYKKALYLPGWTYSTLKVAKRFKPDICIGQALPNLAYASYIFNMPYIIFEDTESATLVQKMSFPFADKIVTPDCYRVDHGPKHIRFNGYYELAYLHPKYFKPDPSILLALGLKAADRYVVMRFVSWSAIHDFGQKESFNLKLIKRAVNVFKKYARVFLTSEIPLPPELEKHRINIPIHRIHDVLYYASVFLGDSGTMATEAALLGTPAVRYTPFSASSELGNFVELEKKYQMVWSLQDPQQVLDKALSLIDTKSLGDYEFKRERMLREKIDINEYMIQLVEASK